MKSVFSIFTLALIIVFAFACKSDSKTEAPEGDLPIDNLEKSMEGLNADGAKVEVMDFQVLKDALPEKLLGMDRRDHEGQKTELFGMSMSSALAVYTDGDKKIGVNLTDTGGLGLAFQSLAAWSSIEVNKETETGYERTTMIDGKKAFERYDQTTKEGEIAVIVKDRLIVTVTGTNVESKDLREALKKIDLDL